MGLQFQIITIILTPYGDNYAITKLPFCTCDAQNDFKKHSDLIKLMHFVMGLDDIYQPIRSSLLTREPFLMSRLLSRLFLGKNLIEAPPLLPLELNLKFLSLLLKDLTITITTKIIKIARTLMWSAQILVGASLVTQLKIAIKL